MPTSPPAEAEPTAAWDSTPPPGYTDAQRKDYHAGYSDGWYGYKYGAACAETPSAAYKVGYDKANAFWRQRRA